jgi:hypothetical protein
LRVIVFIYGPLLVRLIGRRLLCLLGLHWLRLELLLDVSLSSIENILLMQDSVAEFFSEQVV